jgi:septal ring factor EnvC (AmiA/AmiB activator)
MSNRDGRKQINVELPIESIEALHEEKKRTGQPLWELIDQGARMIAQVDDSTERVLQQRVDDLHEKETRLENEIEERQNDLEQVRQTRADAEEKLAQLREQRDSIEELYDEIITTLQTNPKRNILSRKSTLDEIATREYGRPTESNVDEVIQDVQEYCECNDIDIEEHRISKTEVAYTSPSPQSADGGKPYLRSIDRGDN